MIYSLSGKLSAKKNGLIVIEVGGVGFKVVVGKNAMESLPDVGSPVKLFSHLYMREDGLELYGFISEEELS
ncbi:MAG: OB-fold domain-containing protein, partial [Patescibacteria group bacterium]